MAKTIHRNGRYLAWIRTQPCCITGATIDVQAAHTRLGLGGGMGIKPSDYLAVPIQALAHRTQHQMGEKAFWRLHDRDPGDEVLIHLRRFIDAIYGPGAAYTSLAEVGDPLDDLINYIEARRPNRYKK